MTIRRSLAYSIADSYVALPLQIVGTMILSRLLTPAETGVFAVAAVFAAFATSFRDFGVAEYLIQEKNLTEDKIRAALTVNIALSWAMGLLLFFLAPLVANFYSSPGVAQVMRVQAFNFALIPFGAVTMANFRRQLDFRPIFIAGLLANISTFVVASVCALLGQSYMSLAWSSLAGVCATVGTSLWFRPHDFPRWPGFKGVPDVIHFGKFASGIYLFGQLGKGAPEMIIGRALDMSSVALFSRGNGLVELFSRTVMRAVLPVCLPYFAKNNRERGNVNEGYLLSISYITAIGWPFLAFLGIASYAAIRIFYGLQWMSSVHLAQILCAAGTIELVHYVAKEALMACGEVRRSNFLQMGLQTTRILGLLAVIPFGLVGACWGLFAAAVCGALLSQWNLARSTGLRAAAVASTCLPSLYVSIMAISPACIWYLFEGVSEENYWRFAIGGGTLTVIAWGLALWAVGHPLYGEAKTLLQWIIARYADRRRHRQ